MMVSPTQLSVLRMIPIAKRIARAGKGDLAVFRLLNSRRGWDTSHTPVRDAHWALEEMRERLGEPLPVCLVGHSLGGRAAILASDRSEVKSVVALAPWVYPSDHPARVAEKKVLIVHGAKDRIASPKRAHQLAQRLSRQTHTAFVLVRDGKHAMLGSHSVFSSLAAEWATSTLLNRSDHEAIARIARGERLLEL